MTTLQLVENLGSADQAALRLVPTVPDARKYDPTVQPVAAGGPDLLRIADGAKAAGFRLVEVDLSDRSGQPAIDAVEDLTDQIIADIRVGRVAAATETLASSPRLYIDQIWLEDQTSRQRVGMTRRGLLRFDGPAAIAAASLAEKLMPVLDRVVIGER